MRRDLLAGPALLFCPANRPDRYTKALDRADTVILDLEDAVDPTERPAARAALIANPNDPSRVIVRISAYGTADYGLDLQALNRTSYRNVMLAKTAGVQDLTDLSGLQVVALCETPMGVIRAREIADAACVIALMWGAEDLVAAIGGRSSRDETGMYRDVCTTARAQVLLAAASAGRACIDSVYLNISDLDGLASEAVDAAESGFAYKACIHPDQAPVIRTAFRPTTAQLLRARSILDHATGAGASTFDGQMIDAPLIEQARRVVAYEGIS
jgi:citrate lyase subunit beta/citryl-CoA lyase